MKYSEEIRKITEVAEKKQAKIIMDTVKGAETRLTQALKHFVTVTLTDDIQPKRLKNVEVKNITIDYVALHDHLHELQLGETATALVTTTVTFDGCPQEVTISAWVVVEDNMTISNSNFEINADNVDKDDLYPNSPTFVDDCLTTLSQIAHEPKLQKLQNK